VGRTFAAVAGLVAIVIACYAGFRWGDRFAVRRAAEVERKNARESSRRDDLLRQDIGGRWVDQRPVEVADLPLIGRQVVQFDADGVYLEDAQLLAADGQPLHGMVWSSRGTWRVVDGALIVERSASRGPTTRPAGASKYSAVVSGAELSLFTMDSKERGHVLRSLRRELAPRITSSDLESAKDDGRLGAAESAGR